MTDLKDTNLLDFVVEIAHEFEVDLNSVVVVNHRFALDGIDRAENEVIKQREEELAHDDPEALASALSHIEWGFEGLRKASRQLALVGVVTRLQHWISIALLDKRLCGKPEEKSDSMLINQLAFLNELLGCGPVPISFFEELVNVRDSIIHADSKAKWKHGRDRKVADQYTNPWGCVEFAEEDLQEAIDNSIRQVVWYDKCLHSPQNKA